MWDSELLLSDFSSCRSIAFDIHGLWLLCGHLLSSSLSHQNQQKSVCVDNKILDNGLYQLLGPHHICPPYPLLQIQGHQIISSVSSQPCWLWPALTPGSMSAQCLWVLPYYCYCLFLWPCSLCFLSHELRREEGLFNMQPSPHCGDFLLCILCLYLSNSKSPSISNRGQGSGCLLYHLDPSAQPSYLQPEKQGSNGSIEKNNSETLLCENVDKAFCPCVPRLEHKSTHYCTVIKTLCLTERIKNLKCLVKKKKKVAIILAQI